MYGLSSSEMTSHSRMVQGSEAMTPSTFGCPCADQTWRAMNSYVLGIVWPVCLVSQSSWSLLLSELPYIHYCDFSAFCQWTCGPIEEANDARMPLHCCALTYRSIPYAYEAQPRFGQTVAYIYFNLLLQFLRECTLTSIYIHMKRFLTCITISLKLERALHEKISDTKVLN